MVSRRLGLVSAGRANFHACLVVERELIDDIGTGAIVTDHLHAPTLAAKPGDDLVEVTYGRDVPEMSGAHIDHHITGRLLDPKRAKEKRRRL